MLDYLSFIHHSYKLFLSLQSHLFEHLSDLQNFQIGLVLLEILGIVSGLFNQSVHVNRPSRLIHVELVVWGSNMNEIVFLVFSVANLTDFVSRHRLINGSIFVFLLFDSGKVWGSLAGIIFIFFVDICFSQSWSLFLFDFRFFLFLQIELFEFLLQNLVKESFVLLNFLFRVSF